MISDPDNIKMQAYKIKTTFFTFDTLSEVCQRLISQYFLLTHDDLTNWDTDPEGFCKWWFINGIRESHCGGRKNYQMSLQKFSGSLQVLALSLKVYEGAPGIFYHQYQLHAPKWPKMSEGQYTTFNSIIYSIYIVHFGIINI